MKVLVVGSGAREGSLCRAIAASPLLSWLFIAPGNPGTAAWGENLPIPATDIEALAEFAQRESIDLVVVGPEGPLELGIADAMAARHVPCFGPSKAAARIETSKSFSKEFMDFYGIPAAKGRSFLEAGAAKAWAAELGIPVVVKASGPAAGKGVLIPEGRLETERAIDSLLTLGGAGSSIVVEERLEGEEISIIALCDGEDWAVLPAARDHKRLLDGDRGPNTGGMGAYAPACSGALADKLAELFIEPAVRGLAAEGSPFVGALYAGIMLTKEGPKALEYNARFGDPEAQVILPLFASDPLAAMAASARGKLAEARPRFREGSVACVVLAARGYPEHPEIGQPVTLAETLDGATAIQAGTRLVSGSPVPSSLETAGGRVLSAVGEGPDLESALRRAYGLASASAFPGAQFRKDIGARGPLDAAVRASLEGIRPDAPPSAYAAAGVDIDAGNRAVELMKGAVRSTYGPEVLAGIGSFGGLYEISSLKSMERPVLVASTDGVGTKTSLAASLRRFRGVGKDIVNHSIDDILVQGARPLIFLDYFAASRLDPEAVAEAVSGMAEACREAGCALLGGETAEMPGTYQKGEIDIAGTIVGIVEAKRALPRRDLAPGDLLVGLASAGLHTNGYSLARRALADLDLETVHPELGESPADALLRPHRSYLVPLWPAISADASPVKALAHITGGGFIENLPRVLPPGIGAVIDRGSWVVPPIFKLIQRLGSVSEDEMARVFNLGIGMIAVIAPADLPRFLELVPERTYVIGRLEAGEGRVRLA